MPTAVEIDRAAAIAALGLTVKSVFVPFSRSRNKDEKHPSLNWRVTIERNGRDVVSCDYSAGVGHCPAYNRKIPAGFDRPARMWRPLACAFECEEGFALGPIYSWSCWRADKTQPITPDPLDVLYSLTMDTSVLDFATFEDWASEYGYDPDSRKGEAIYRACLEIALKLRAALGDSGLAEISAIFQDY